MAIINVSIKTAQGFIKRQVAQVQGMAQRQTFVLAEATKIVIRETIHENITRPGSTGLLADSFHAEMTARGAGVGRISFLNKEVKYWRHQNFGSLAIGANWQHRVPKGNFAPGDPTPNEGSFGNGRWSSPGKYSFIPKNPIPAKNYIEKSLAKIIPKINIILKNA